MTELHTDLENSRFQLQKYLNKQQTYQATFQYITHKVNSEHKKVAVILLTDVYPVTKSGKKIRLANSSDFKDRKGRHIAADHIWIKLTKPWFNVSNDILPHIQLFSGDVIQFSAKVTEYKRVRKDELDKRDLIYKQAQEKCDQMYKRWQRYTDTHYRKNFQLSLNKLKVKQKKIMDEAKKEQSEIKLVDYSFNNVKNIKLTDINSDITIDSKNKSGYIREQMNYDRYKDDGYTYSAFLAAYSMNYQQGKVWN